MKYIEYVLHDTVNTTGIQILEKVRICLVLESLMRKHGSSLESVIAYLTESLDEEEA